MNDRTRRTRSAAPRPTPNTPQPEMVDAMVEDYSEAPTMAYPGPVAPAPYMRRSLAEVNAALNYDPEYDELDPDATEWTEAHMLALPFPGWLTLGAPIALLLTLAAVFIVETAVLGGDWATGALAVSLTAFALALVTIGLMIARVALGRRSFGSIVLAGLLALTLVASGVGGIVQANPLRRAQASQAESAGNWELAVNEYTQAGERPPTSTNLARAYTGWGEMLMQHGDYAGATQKLTTVIQKYPDSGDLVTRARADQYTVYSKWIASGAITLPFKQSLEFLAAYSNDAACDATCKTSIVNLQGQAHYQYGEQLAKANQFKQAIVEFDLVQSQFGKSTFVGKAHTAGAVAYWSLGQEVLGQDCITAIPLYQTLASRYGDTSQGQQAKTALAAPQTVKGTMTGTPSNPVPTLYLSKNIDTNANIYSHDYKATFDPKTGAYSFANVAQGTYYLTTYRSISSTQEAFTYYKDTNTGNPYSFQVGPLCSTDLPTMGY
ncbi:MAG TPA: tetratricopeptide repeat protein [Ktedonobacterales bacterium]